MGHRTERLVLGGTTTGTEQALLVHRFGKPGGRPKAYIQASLHANETPAMLVAHHLIRELAEAVSADSVLGEVVVVPYANPIGLAQILLSTQIGRFNFDGGGNFNRGFPNLAPAVGERVGGRLGSDAARNVAAIRKAALATLDALPAEAAQDALRVRLMQLAVDADIVIDLHSDQEALLHLYVGNWLWPASADLAAQIGAEATMSAEVYGNFDHSCSTLWLNLARQFGDSYPIPHACLAATVELRGQADVDDSLAAADADNLLRFFMRRAVIAGDPGPLPPLHRDATPYDGVDVVTASVAGVAAFAVPLGATVQAGDVVADIVDPAASDPFMARTPVRCRTSGVVFARRLHKYVRAGDGVAKVAGRTAVEGGGALYT